MESVSALQLLTGILVLGSALSVVMSKNPIVSAIMLMSTLFLTGAMYFGLGLYFIGAVQILIYAGAIAVIFVFIVMLLDLKTLSVAIPGRRIVGALGFLVAALALFSLCASLLTGNVFTQGAHSEGLGLLSSASPKAISLQFLSKYMLAFQATGLLIFAAVMGAVVLGKPAPPSNLVEGETK